jgi:predicted N-acetyltransferase YhbS
MALSGVCVTPSHRGQGLGRDIARDSLARVDRGEFAVALLGLIGFLSY